MLQMLLPKSGYFLPIRLLLFVVGLSNVWPPIMAQPQTFPSLSYKVIANGRPLVNGLAGGLNAAQFSSIDLNRDGLDDLFVFDRVGDKVLTFLNKGKAGQPDYRYAPEYACEFPPLNDYALLRDYNRDGVMDIFTAATTDQELRVFRGIYRDGRLTFTPFLFTYASCRTCDRRHVYYPDETPGVWVNLAIAKSDLPDIDDVDSDGDLDILTFEASVGGRVWWLRNMSVERGFKSDSLHFVKQDDCWGRMYELGLAACKCELSPSPNTCSNGITGGSQPRDVLHPGSTLLTYDDDGDGDKELILGDISFTCLNMLVNGGNRTQAWMNNQYTAFPPENPLDITVFPAAFYLDIDQDGKKDLVAAPNSRTIGEDRFGTWWYRNVGTGAQHRFELSTKSLLNETMIDVGSNAQPAFVDVNGDGLQDLVIGATYFTTSTPFYGTLFLYQNTGTFSEPIFTLVDADWQGLSSFAPNDYEFSPAFADMDNDGDQDMIVGGLQGVLYYYQNTAGAGRPMRLERDRNPMWELIDIGISASPTAVDVDKDGKNDLLIGERNGNVNYYRNIGSPTEPRFGDTPTVQFFGGIDPRRFAGDVVQSAPAVLPTPTGNLLAVGLQTGNVQVYGNITASVSPLPQINEAFGNIDDGARVRPAFADLDDDGILEMALGNGRGGITMYKTTLQACKPTSNVRTNTPTLRAHLWPNPVQHSLYIQAPLGGNLHWRVLDALGRTIIQGENETAYFQVNTAVLPNGRYTFQVHNGQQQATQTFVKQ